MPNIRNITITSACATDPPHPHLSLAGYDGVQWHSSPPNLYYLVLPGGVFVGHPIRFIWPVLGATPTTPLILVKPLPIPPPTISNYIFDPIGRNCVSVDADNPPDIIIDSVPLPPPRKGKKKKK